MELDPICSFGLFPRLGTSKLDDDDDDFGLMAMIPMEVKEKLFRLKIENKKLKEQINQVQMKFLAHEKCQFFSRNFLVSILRSL